jgi:hypothetical protein
MTSTSTDQPLASTQGEAAAPATKAQGYKWHDRVTWPMLTGLASSVVLTLWTAILPYAPVVLEGCTSQQKQQVRAAEQALNDEQLVRAGDIGEEVLMFAPSCRCAHLLMAKVHHRQYRAAQQAGNGAKARQERKLCLQEALQAREPFSTPPGTQSLIDGCSATPST